MDDQNEPVFTADQVAAVSTALRVTLGLPPQNVTLQRFIGLISDEIRQLRAQGWSDQEIAAMVHDVSGEPVAAESVARFYVAPGQHSSP